MINIKNKTWGRTPLDPGSLAAVKKGCKCPREANNNGRGVRRKYSVVYEISPKCPLHNS